MNINQESIENKWISWFKGRLRDCDEPSIFMECLRFVPEYQKASMQKPMCDLRIDIALLIKTDTEALKPVRMKSIECKGDRKYHIHWKFRDGMKPVSIKCTFEGGMSVYFRFNDFKITFDGQMKRLQCLIRSSVYR